MIEAYYTLTRSQLICRFNKNQLQINFKNLNLKQNNKVMCVALKSI